MNDLNRMMIEQACRRLMAAYCHAADHNDCAGFLDVFTEDARWVRPGGEVITGHNALRTFFLARPGDATVRHVCSNALVDVVDARSARGICYTTVYRHGGKSPLPGPAAALQSLIEYRDDFLRTAAGWRIANRQGTTVFRQTG